MKRKGGDGGKDDADTAKVASANAPTVGWIVQVDLGRGPDGRRRRKTAYAATQGAAVKLLKRLGGRQVDGQLLATSTPTVGEVRSHQGPTEPTI